MSIFEFRTGNTLAHTLDPRCKFALICLTGAGLASASLPACLALLFLMMPPLFRIGIGPFALVGQLKYFILFLSFIILAKGLAVPGPELFSIFTFPVSRPGLVQGGLVALRFFTVMVLGITFSATTRPSQVKTAVQWILKPIPWVPEQRAGVIISLALRFLPMIHAQARESRQAILARCGNRQKNPLKRIGVFSLALLGKTLENADHLAMAMEARCYSESRTDPGFSPSGKEPLALAGGIGLFLVLIAF